MIHGQSSMYNHIHLYIKGDLFIIHAIHSLQNQQKLMFFCLLKWQMTLSSTKMNYILQYEGIHIIKNIILIQNDRIFRQKPFNLSYF